MRLEGEKKKKTETTLPHETDKKAKKASKQRERERQTG